MTAVVGALAALLVLGAVLRLVVRGRLRVRYAGLWLAVAVLAAVLALTPHLLSGTAGALGFRVPANFVFFAGLVLLVVVGVHLSVAVTTLEDRVQRLVEEFALAAERAGAADRAGAAELAGAAERAGSDQQPGSDQWSTAAGAAARGSVGASSLAATASSGSSASRAPADLSKMAQASRLSR